jgi:hypothetical protein
MSLSVGARTVVGSVQADGGVDVAKHYGKAEALAQQAEAALGSVNDPAQKAVTLALLALVQATLEAGNDIAGVRGEVTAVRDAVASLDAEVEKFRLNS